MPEQFKPESKQPDLVFAGTPERYEKWQEPVEVVNALKELDLPSLQEIEGTEVSPEEAVDIDDRALRQPDCVSVCYGRPHTGEFVPESIWDRTTPEGKRTLVIVDRGTDQIFRSEDVPSVGTKISRFIVDPNRPPLPNPESKVPGKVLWEEGLEGPIYQEGKVPDEEEVADWRDRFYLPYYNSVMGVVGSLLDRRENPEDRVLFVDGHSFPVGDLATDYLVKNYGMKEPIELPMFIIGDGGDKSCDKDIREAFVAALQGNFDALSKRDQEKIMAGVTGGLVGINFPFKGVHNVDFFGQRPKGVNALQVECNETAYYDDEDGDYYSGQYNMARVAIVQKLIEQTCKDVDPLLKNK